jgi:hypothetical protein
MYQVLLVTTVDDRSCVHVKTNVVDFSSKGLADAAIAEVDKHNTTLIVVKAYPLYARS